MIKKFSKINYGSYQDFSWNNLQEFQKLNIFYGRNYAGKTTLSRILRSFEVKNPHSDYMDSTFEIEMTDSNPTSLTLTKDNITDNNLTIRVYNKDFVKENLGFLIDDKAGDIKAFASVVVGEENNKIQVKIQELQNKLGNEKEDKENNISISGLYKDLQDLENEKVDISKQINTKKQNKKLSDEVNIIKSDSRFIKQGTNYDIRNIKKDIETIKQNASQYTLTQDKKDEYSDIIEDKPKNPINFSPLFEQNKFSQIINQVKELVEKKIIAKENIANDLRKWLEKGLELHEHDNEKCKFCENPLSQEILQKLIERIKDDSNDKIKLEDGLKKWLENFENYKIKNDEILPIEKDVFYNQNKEKFYELEKSLNKNIEKYNKELENIKNQVSSKQDNIFGDFEFDHSKITDFLQDIQNDLEAIKNLCEENDQKSQTLEAEQTKARKALRLDEVARFINSIDYFKVQEEIKELEDTIESKDKEIKTKEQEIEKIKKEIQKLQDSLSDEKAGADKANKYLKSFFGNNQLEFKSIPEKKGEFKIHRNNEAAKNLSEGECSLLAFCYFVAKLQDKDTKDKKPIIWIDDPICSLDNNHIFFIFSLIESQIAKPKNYTQLFISTHNLDFLRYLKSLTGFQWRDNKKTPMFLIEKQQSSTIKNLPPYMQKYITEFNYLFEQIYKCSNEQDNAIETFYNVANNIRKFLESYLFFKYPNVDSLMSKYEKFFKDNQEAVFINRIINEFSHLEENPERANEPLDLLEIQKASKIVIETIKQKDKEQFNALLESIGKGEDINNDK